jgi:hypothetical protein
MICEQYETQTERDSLISYYESIGYIRVEERNLTEGDFICFEETSIVEAEIAEAERLRNIWNNLKDDPLWKGLMTATYQQIDNWIDNNVTDLATARDVFKRLVKVVAFLVRELK